MKAAIRRPSRQQSGFVLVLAIFMLVMLASISAYLLTISNLQVQTAAQDELSSRAYQSARTGIEWGTYQILRTPAQAFATACQAGASQTEGANTFRAYAISATACNQAACPGTAGATYVERQLKISLVN